MKSIKPCETPPKLMHSPSIPPTNVVDMEIIRCMMLKFLLFTTWITSIMFWFSWNHPLLCIGKRYMPPKYIIFLKKNVSFLEFIWRFNNNISLQVIFSPPCLLYLQCIVFSFCRLNYVISASQWFVAKLSTLETMVIQQSLFSCKIFTFYWSMSKTIARQKIPIKQYLIP